MSPLKKYLFRSHFLIFFFLYYAQHIFVMDLTNQTLADGLPLSLSFFLHMEFRNLTLLFLLSLISCLLFPKLKDTPYSYFPLLIISFVLCSG